MLARSKKGLASAPSRTASSARAVERGKFNRNRQDLFKPAPGKKAARRKLAFISANVLMRDSLVLALGEGLGAEVVVSASVDDWVRQADPADCDLIVIHCGGEQRGCEIARLGQLLEPFGGRPHFIIIADCERPSQVIEWFQRGARGYVPTSVSLDVMIEAIRLVLVGGVYCPPCMVKVHDAAAELQSDAPVALTPREASVYKAVSEGQPNKVIAGDLGLSEGTIKVHVHRIMKKLNVRNRTQIAICRRD
jgi:DNA-binding NarL/FixJ family response regulator